MKYSDFSLYPYLWVFKRDDMGVDPVDMDQIKPLTPRAADELWQAQISKNGNHCTDLRKGDWAKNQNTWTTETRWDSAFEADDHALPEAVDEQLEWDPNTVVWICYGSDHVLETNWRVFRRNWKCFLFADEAALVIGKRRQQALFFVDDTLLRIGNRPS